jgi:hypothetical protein
MQTPLGAFVGAVKQAGPTSHSIFQLNKTGNFCVSKNGAEPLIKQGHVSHSCAGSPQNTDLFSVSPR